MARTEGNEDALFWEMAALALTSSAPHQLNLGGRSRLAHLRAGDHFGQVGGLPDGQG